MEASQDGDLGWIGLLVTDFFPPEWKTFRMFFCKEDAPITNQSVGEQELREVLDLQTIFFLHSTTVY